MSKQFNVRNAVLATAAALSMSMFSSSATAEGLGDALASAYKNSGLLEQNRAALRATDEGVASAFADLRPTFTYSAKVSNSAIKYSGSDWALGEWNKQLTFNASMEIYTFGRNKLSVDAAKETVLATRASLVNIEQSVLSTAVSAYMNAREQQAVLNLRQSAVRLGQQNLRASKDRFEVGEITRTEVSQFEAQLASAQAQLSAAVGEVAVAREAYKAAIGHYPTKLSTPPRIKLPASSVDEAVRIAKQRHPAIKAFQHQVSASDLAVEIAERNMLPTIDASATAYGETEDNYTSTSLSLTASGTIYSGGAVASAIRSAIAGRDQSRAALLQSTRDIDQSVRANWAMLSVFGASEQASQSLVKAQRVAYNGVREEADLGASTTLDVLDAEQDLLDAQVSAIQAKISRETQSYAVLQTLGMLTVEHLNLNVPVYDAAAYYNSVKNAPTRYVSPEGDKLDRVLKALGRN